MSDQIAHLTIDEQRALLEEAFKNNDVATIEAFLAQQKPGDRVEQTLYTPPTAGTTSQPPVLGGIRKREVDDAIRGLIQSPFVKSKAYEMLTEAGENVENYTHWEVVEAKEQVSAGSTSWAKTTIWAKVKVQAYKRDPEILKMIEGGEEFTFPMFIASVIVQNKETDTALEVVVVCEDGHEEAFTLSPAERRTVEVIREGGAATFYRPIKSMRTRPVILGGERGPKEGWIARELGPVTQYIKNLPVVLDKEGGDLKADPSQEAFEPELFVHVKILEALPKASGGVVAAIAAVPQVLAVQALKTKADKLEGF